MRATIVYYNGDIEGVRLPRKPSLEKALYELIDQKYLDAGDKILTPEGEFVIRRSGGKKKLQQVFPRKVATQELWRATVRLAHEKPPLRGVLLPLLVKHSQEKFIQKAIKDPGALRKHYGVKEGEDIPVGKAKKDLKKLQEKPRGTKRF